MREFRVLYNVHYLSALLANLGSSSQKARFISDHLDEERRRLWRAETWPAIVRLARARDALILFGDEASFAQWGSLGYTWAPRGRAATGQDVWPAQSLQGLRPDRLSHVGASSPAARLSASPARPTCCLLDHGAWCEATQPLLLIQDGAPYHTAVATRAYCCRPCRPAERLPVAQLLARLQSD